MLKNVFFVSLLAAAMAHAAVVRLDIKERSDILDGKTFGNVGAYERIVGRAHFVVNPRLPANQAIVDIDKAPRNRDGMVEFSSDIFLLRPKNPKKGNGTVLYEVSNRGNKSMLTHFNRAATSFDPRSSDDFGDGLLMNQGYTLLWVGWQFDMPDAPHLVYLYPPVAEGVKGIVRAELTLDRHEASYSVADRNHKPYTVLNPDDPNLRLTVRDQVEGPRTAIPRADWHIENGATIVPKNGFDPGRIYELVYTSENPPVAGTGFAAVRDVISWLRYGSFVAGAPTPMIPLKRAYGFGVSQSGRFLRTMLYYGFNRDERDRKVFDSMLIDVAGGGRGGFNMRFAQPSRDSNPFANTLTPVDIFPFTDLEQTDPQTGIKDGLLTHSLPPEFWPKIFYMNSEYEYYGRAASLIHIALDGSGDVKLPVDHAHLYVQRRPAWAFCFPAVASGHAESIESQSLYLDLPRAARQHGRLDQKWHRAAAIEISKRRVARAGAPCRCPVPQDPRRRRLFRRSCISLTRPTTARISVPRASRRRNRRKSANRILCWFHRWIRMVSMSLASACLRLRFPSRLTPDGICEPRKPARRKCSPHRPVRLFRSLAPKPSE